MFLIGLILQYELYYDKDPNQTISDLTSKKENVLLLFTYIFNSLSTIIMSKFFIFITKIKIKSCKYLYKL